MSRFTSWLAELDPRVWAAVAVVTAILLIAASIGGFFAYQNLQPTTATLNLRNGQAEVPLDKSLVLDLTRPASLESLKGAFRLSPAIDGTMTAAPGFKAFAWKPTGPWDDLTGYTVSLEAFKDTAGHQVTPARWSFTTTIVPRVVSLATDQGTVLADSAELPLDSSLKVAFNDAMDPATTQLTLNGKPVALTWDADSKAAAFSTKGSPAGPADFAIAPGGKDRGGRALSTEWKLHTTLVFRVSEKTVALKFPALVQIPNDPGARDQSGLQSANMIYEYVTEGGITRFTAIYQNAADVVGPVRSGRLISFKLTRHYHGMLFLSGVSEGTFARLNADPVPTFFDTQGFFYRSRDRQAPNNLYINGDAIKRAEDGTGINAYTLATAAPSVTGDAGTSVSVAQHASTYTYDPGTATYTKSEDNHQFNDALISQPLRIRMVIVFHTSATTTSYVEDVNGAHGLDFNMESGGRADIYFGGQHASGKWVGSDRNNPITFQLDNGQAVPMPSGLVWIDVVTG